MDNSQSNPTHMGTEIMSRYYYYHECCNAKAICAHSFPIVEREEYIKIPQGLRQSSVVNHVLTMYEALGSM